MSSYTEKGFDGKTLPYSTDARLWAKEFVKISSINLSAVFDEHEMTRWFDGAIQAGIEEAERIRNQPQPTFDMAPKGNDA